MEMKKMKRIEVIFETVDIDEELDFIYPVGTKVIGENEEVIGEVECMMDGSIYEYYGKISEDLENIVDIIKLRNADTKLVFKNYDEEVDTKVYTPVEFIEAFRENINHFYDNTIEEELAKF